ncbi:hypothetical protein ACPA9J_00060 [Pseudomonas aeruginosa]
MRRSHFPRPEQSSSHGQIERLRSRDFIDTRLYDDNVRRRPTRGGIRAGQNSEHEHTTTRRSFDHRRPARRPGEPGRRRHRRGYSARLPRRPCW